MSTVTQFLTPEEAHLDSSGALFIPRGLLGGGVLAFEDAADKQGFWKLSTLGYASGNLTIKIHWYADTATSGDVRWGAALAAITPDADTQDVETKTLATEQTFDDTHLGTTAHRLHTATITLSNLDSLADGDAAWLRIRRVGSNGADTMTGDAMLERVTVSYTT